MGSKVSKKIRSSIYKEQRYICFYSGLCIARQERSIEHILPISRGGGNKPSNLIMVHKSLNRSFGDKQVDEKINHWCRITGSPPFNSKKIPNFNKKTGKEKMIYVKRHIQSYNRLPLHL